MSRFLLLPLLTLPLSILPAHAANLLLCPGAPLASPGALTQDYATPDGQRLRAIVTDETGKPEPACRSVPLGVAASGVQALHFLPPDARPGAAILLQGEDRDQRFKVTSHQLERDTPPPPSPPATLDARRQDAPRSTWAWSPNAWRERAERLLDWAAERRITEVFINVPVRAGQVAEPALLAAFVRQAQARGIGVIAFEDDPTLLLPASRPDAVARLRAYAAYNEKAQPAARLQAVQLDIQPQLVDPEVLPEAERDARYLELAAALRQVGASLRLDFVVPAAWSDKNQVLRGLARHADSLTVRNYRTDPARIVRYAAPFLDWGMEHGKKVRIALEAGPVGAGVEREYRRLDQGAKGDLLLYEVGGQKVLVLLTVPGAQKDEQVRATPYALRTARDIAGPETTFHADKAALMRLLPRLEQTLGAWSSFGGIALHELR